jgi:competence protein ComEA
MSRLSSGQRVGVLAIMVMVALVVGITGLRAWQAASAPGITLREQMPHSVTLPPPTQPPVAPALHPAPQSPPADISASPAITSANELVVHVVGAVHRPGVYHLRSGARWDDALHAAGGPTLQANTNAINLAARLVDGTQLYVPTHTEHPEDHALITGPSAVSSAETTAAAVTGKGKSAGKQGSSSRQSGSGRSNKLTSLEQEQIDLNSATSAELQRIPGIGPSLAERLIAYRQQNGGFHSIDDLLQVSGIGQKKYEKMKGFVKIGPTSGQSSTQ